MAKEHEIVTATRDGVEVSLDLTWCRSWEGIRAAAGMSDERAPDAERLLATAAYYAKACPNIDDVSAALEARSEDEVTANDVMAFVAEAVHDAMGADESKN